MHYIINVTHRGIPYLAAPMYCPQDRKKAVALAMQLKVRFPIAEGYEVSLRWWTCSGGVITIPE